jgi:hypothetical protein
MNELQVYNDGPKIVESNFWGLPDNGKFLVSVNAKAFRILLPASLEGYVSEMATAREVAISRGPWPAQGKQDAFELLFDDGSDNPFVLHTIPETFDRLPLPADEGRGDLACLVYVGKDGKPVEALALTCGYRRVSRLPWLKPLKRTMR